MSTKVLSTHLQRRAVVYLRQSTPRQVFDHAESTARQYALIERARTLGWEPECIEAIDEDLGKSGTTATDRSGFQRLAEEVAHGKIGIILALEVSRLARCNADWHHLLDLCSFADVLIADEQAVYNPVDYNDRLLLGLKGTMSEAEIYWMRLRLQGGKMNKARRGELHYVPPWGYVWDADAKSFRFDPDEGVQQVVRLVFERFRIDGTAYAIVDYLARHEIKIPLRHSEDGERRWVPARHSLILFMLHNPIYAGAYVFGRHEERAALVNGVVKKRHVTKLEQDSWKVLLRDQHPAYISWEEFMDNQARILSNCTHHKEHPDQQGAAREGCALLQGLVLCGKCGRRMSTDYHGVKERGHYECRSAAKQDGSNRGCWYVPARAIDQAVVELFMQTIQPPHLELALAVFQQASQQAAELDRTWSLRLEALQFEARLAERRYKAVDPDNRVVARTLEHEWNAKLQEMAHLEDRHLQEKKRLKVELTADDRNRIITLAKDLPTVWHAETTTNAERKNLLRLVIEQVTLTPVDIPDRATRIQVLWRTGDVNDCSTRRHDKRTAAATSDPAVQLIRDLVLQNQTNEQIAASLNVRGLITGKGNHWNAKAVAWVRSCHHLRSPLQPPKNARLPDRRGDGLFSIHGIAARFGVSDHIVRYWMEHGWIKPVEGDGRHAYWFKLSPATIQRLKAAKRRGYGSRRQNSQHPLQEV